MSGYDDGRKHTSPQNAVSGGCGGKSPQGSGHCPGRCETSQKNPQSQAIMKGILYSIQSLDPLFLPYGVQYLQKLCAQVGVQQICEIIPQAICLNQVEDVTNIVQSTSPYATC